MGGGNGCNAFTLLFLKQLKDLTCNTPMQWLISNRCPSNINYLRTLMYFHPDRPKTDWLIQAVSKTGQQDRTSPKLWLTWSLQAETYLANIRQHLRYTSHRARHTQLQLKNHKIGFSHVYLVSESTNTPDNKMSQGSQQRSKNPSQNCAHERGKKKKKKPVERWDFQLCYRKNDFLSSSL